MCVCVCVYSHNYSEGRDTSQRRVYLTCAEFHKETRLMVTGCDDGSFTVHEMPHFTLLQSFTSVSSLTHSSLSLFMAATAPVSDGIDYMLVHIISSSILV